MARRIVSALLPLSPRAPQAWQIAPAVRSRPAMQVALGVAGGIAWMEWIQNGLPWQPVITFLAALLLILICPRWTLMIVAALLGGWRYALWSQVEPLNPSQLPPAVRLRAIGALEPVRTGNRLLCAFASEDESRGYALLYFRSSVASPPDYGDEFVVRVSWRAPRNSPGIPFDWARYLQRRRIYYIATIYHDSQFRLLRSQEGSWQRWFIGLRRSLHRLFYARLSKEDAALMEGVMVGATGDFPRPLREAFMRSGIGHLLSTSGLHVAMVLQMLEGLLLWLLIPFRGRVAILIAGAWGYALLSGMRPPITRAATMASLYLIAPLLRREADGLSALGWAAALWLLYAPYALFEVGFQFSFCAVLFILLFYRRVERWLQRGLRLFVRTDKGWQLGEKLVVPPLTVSLCAQVGIGLLQLYHFGYLSLLSPIANLVAAPAAYLALALGGFFWLSQGVGVLPIEWTCAWLKGVALLFGADWVPAIRTESLPVWLVLAFYGIALLLAREPATVEATE